MGDKFFINEKYGNFLLLADGDDSARAYAFRFQGKIIYLEDIPLNYPSIGIMEVSLEELKKIIEELRRNGWLVRIDRTKEAD